MKSYPSIPGAAKSPLGKPCIAFVKYDGSNLRWEWSKKRGFHKFGSRTRLFDETDLQLGEAVPLFFERYAEPIEKALVDGFRNVEKATAFTEFFGESSFAGTHVEGEPKQLRLFDVQIHKKGILGPRDFLKSFGHLDFSAEIIREGNFSKEFIADVRAGRVVPDGDEGVVVKGGNGHQLWMSKVKTEGYLKKLREVFGSRWTEYAE